MPTIRRPQAELGAVKLLANLVLSLLVGAICVWLVVGGMDGKKVIWGLQNLSGGAVALYVATLAATHFFRAWRWEYLLRPIGVSLPLRRILPISSIGFMAILALPVRLGEFVRPYLATRDGSARMSAVLGTVAVERIVDGLLISLLFFVSYLLSADGSYSPELRFAAWFSLVAFVLLTAFLAIALRWTDFAIKLALRLSLLHWLSPRLSERVADKVRSLISGFRVLADGRNLFPFLIYSLLYWGMNGLGMWLLALDMGLPISLGAAYATMAFTGVLISLPNAPALLGQFHLGIKAGLSAYLPAAVVNSTGIAYAVALHGIQAIWYVGVGLVSLAFTGGSLGRAVRESKRAAGVAAALLLLLTPSPSLARSEQVVPYVLPDVWPAAIRFLRVDRGYPVKEKDESGSYVLFDYPERGKAYPAAIELVRTTDPDGRDATRVVFTIPDLPRRFEIALCDALARKLREERGNPPAPPPRKPSSPAPDRGDRPKPDGGSAPAPPSAQAPRAPGPG